MPDDTMPRRDIYSIAARLMEQQESFGPVPDIHMDEAGAFLQDCLGLLFPQLARSRPKSAREIEARLVQLSGRLRYVLCEVMPELCSEAEGIARRFVASLPEIAGLVRLDAEAALEGDPAADSLHEVILSYPSVYAVATYRLAHSLASEGVTLLPRLMSEYAHRLTGIDVHPRARIGRRFFIDHGTAVVIGETTVIGDNVKIYQGVTLGALSVKREFKNAKRHPTIEDDVVIYSNATILGGGTVIGRGAVIGGNVWLTKSVPPGARVMYRSVGWQGLAEPEPQRPDDYTV
ncbi:MAG: serine O-acetyltransferase [Rhodothalassiaceae bacterium]